MNQSQLPFFKADVCGSECISGFLLNHHLPPSLIHEAATADYLLIGRSLLTVTVTHPRCSACFTVFNGRLAENDSARICGDHFQSTSWVLADAAGWCKRKSGQRRWGDDVLVNVFLSGTAALHSFSHCLSSKWTDSVISNVNKCLIKIICTMLLILLLALCGV